MGNQYLCVFWIKTKKYIQAFTLNKKRHLSVAVYGYLATPFGETARFWLGVSKLLWNAATSKVYCYLYIYKGYVSVHVEVITRSVWCSFQWNLSDQQTRTNERKKSKTDRIYEWKMLTLKICSSECSKHDNGNFICKMSINIRDHIVLIFYYYFL